LWQHAGHPALPNSLQLSHLEHQVAQLCTRLRLSAAAVNASQQAALEAAAMAAAAALDQPLEDEEEEEEKEEAGEDAPGRPSRVHPLNADLALPGLTADEGLRAALLEGLCFFSWWHCGGAGKWTDGATGAASLEAPGGVGDGRVEQAVEILSLLQQRCAARAQEAHTDDAAGQTTTLRTSVPAQGDGIMPNGVDRQVGYKPTLCNVSPGTICNPKLNLTNTWWVSQVALRGDDSWRFTPAQLRWPQVRFTDLSRIVQHSV
jgi:hypothetical protein